MLKGDQFWDRGDSEVSFRLNEVQEAGVIVIYPDSSDVTSPALDDAENIATVPTNTDGDPIGILLDTMVSLDLNRSLPIESRREVQLGGKVEIIRRGWFVTDQVDTGATPVPGAAAYFMAGGLFTTDTGSAQVGRFESSADADGYVRIRVEL